MLAKPILLAKPVEGRSPVSLSVTEVRAVVLRSQRLAEDVLPFGRSKLSGDGRHYAAAAPASVLPSDAAYLTSKGLTDSQIQLILGHESKKSLDALPTPITRIGR